MICACGAMMLSPSRLKFKKRRFPMIDDNYCTGADSVAESNGD